MNALAITFTYVLSIWLLVAFVVEAVARRWRTRRAVNRRIALSLTHPVNESSADTSTNAAMNAPTNSSTVRVLDFVSSSMTRNKRLCAGDSKTIRLENVL